uniref:Uncharacterized protein n=1 Tax=uncultured bacterium ws156A7 TaxID=1131828 RepID=I1X4R7_9BACT|nr:hypothetical protein ws156A7_0013 [uncultured bacterium ws156A7]
MTESSPFLRPGLVDLGAESGEDTVVSSASLRARLETIDAQLSQITTVDSGRQRAGLLLSAAEVLLGLEDGDQTWRRAFAAFNLSLELADRELAVQACELLFLANQDDSLAALGQGVWLAVTFPIDPSLSVRMLRHIMEETPDEADGAAIAAASAAYIVDLRAEGRVHNDLSSETLEMLGTVAREHAGVRSQADFDAWVARLELDTPEKFLVRLRNVIDVLVQDQWWFDRDALQAQLPEH